MKCANYAIQNQFMNLQTREKSAGIVLFTGSTKKFFILFGNLEWLKKVMLLHTKKVMILEV